MEENQKWSYTGSLDSEDSPQSVGEISWSASEYISHSKGGSWYLVAAGATVVLAALSLLIYHEILTTAAFLVICLSIIFLASRKPTQRSYAINDHGITVDNKKYNFDNFKSFSLVEEGAISSIWLKPLGRYKPLLILYFDPSEEEKIVDTLSYYLPYEDRELDGIDKLSRRLRL